MTTAGLVEAAFVDLANATCDSLSAFRSWPGTASTQRMMYLTETIWTSTDFDSSGARFMREIYAIEFEVWSFAPGASALDLTSRDEAYADLSAIQSAVVADPKLGLAECVSMAVLAPGRGTPVEFERGYAMAIPGALEVTAFYQ